MDNHNADENYNLFNALMSLPFFIDNIYLSMQAQNIAVVDAYLRDLEQGLVIECWNTERTPVSSAVFVAALSQMWVFAAYELLRTWKQMAQEIIIDIESPAPNPEASDQTKSGRSRRIKKVKRTKVSEESVEYYNDSLSKAASNPDIIKAIQHSRDAIKPAFRRLTEIRIALAKHEVAGAASVHAHAPGYSRIDTTTGSIYWMVDKKDGTSEIISRRDLADDIQQCCSPKETI